MARAQRPVPFKLIAGGGYVADPLNISVAPSVKDGIKEGSRGGKKISIMVKQVSPLVWTDRVGGGSSTRILEHGCRGFTFWHSKTHRHKGEL